MSTRARGAVRLPWAVLAVVLVLAVLATCSAPFWSRQARTEPVWTASGPVVGVQADGLRVFLGVPYAAAPVGSRRWKPPEPVKPWTEPLLATRFGPACPQPVRLSNRGIGRMNEDCLYLNIWTPARTGSDSLPVMVWVHGGGFELGAGSSPFYDGRFLAGHGVVVVTFNYRVGAFGFLAHPKLTEETPYHASGNYGILDQIAALRWVQDNIAAFGGSPDNVTVFGQSAGGVSIAVLMVSPLAQGLFDRAIVQSGAAPKQMARLNEYVPGFEPAESLGTRFSRRLGIRGQSDELAHMRARPCKAVLRAWSQVLKEHGGPRQLVGLEVLNALIVDGRVLEEPVGLTFEQGRQASVPFISGTVKDEGSIFGGYSKVRTQLQYEILVKLWVGDRAQEYLELRPVRTQAEVRPAMAELVNDGFSWNARFMARSMARIQENTFLYHFTRQNLWGKSLGLGVFHALDVGYLFNTLPRLSGDRRSRELSEQMAGYWTRFARTGDPNSPESVEWPRYDVETDEHLVLDLPVTTGSGLRKAACDILDSAPGW